jgi:phosphate transport system substrate-binding protein
MFVLLRGGYNMKKFKILFTLSLLCLILALIGCTVDTDVNPPNLEVPSFTVDTYPVVDGSTVTIPLSEALGAKLMNIPVEEARQYIIHNKTHQAYLNLIDKKADLIFVTSPSAEELQLAKAAGLELELIPVVSEGFVFLTNKDNPVTDLTLQQIRDIYAGDITNWLAIGGSDVPIIAYQRPVNSGSQTGFLDLVMNGITPVDPPMEQIIAEMGALIDAVATYKNEPDAIGYSYFYFVTDMWGNDKVKLLSVDGVYPEKATIQDGTYPIRTAYYAVVRSDEPQDSPARQIIAWLLSDDGQQLAEEAGYVKIK